MLRHSFQLIALATLFYCPDMSCAAEPATDNGFLSSDEKWLAPLQGVSWSDDFKTSVGGELRYRYLNERNRLRPPLAAGSSNYQQWRFNPYVEATYMDDITVRVEGIDASTFDGELPLLGIDQNRWDLLQYYVDLNLYDFENDGSLHFRYGRQFLKFGSQHLVSPLAWANTYRNFEGSRLYYTSKDWDIDAFAVQPVHEPASLNLRPQSFDNPDQSRWFSGVYSSYKGIENRTVDLYWLWLREKADRADRIDGNRHTIGARFAGKEVLDGADLKLTWTWDNEAAYQFGSEAFNGNPDQDISAGFVSINEGIEFTDVTWKPQLNGIFWWGSGDGNPTNGTSSTVNTLFPLGHAYWGQIDNFNGQNLLDYGVHLTVNPTEKFSFLTGWHWFDKAARQDAIYNVVGAPFGGVTTTGSRHLGNELDLIATYKVNANWTLQAGYFHFWYGDGVTNHPNPLVANRGDAGQFYFLTDLKF